MADISLIIDDCLDDPDEGTFRQEYCEASFGNVQIDDDSLPPFQRVQRYIQSRNVYDRQALPRLLPQMFKTVPIESLKTDLPLIMDALCKLADEDEVMVRTDLLEQVPNLAMAAASHIPSLTYVLNDYLLPLVVHNLGTADNQVRKTAHSTLFTLLEQGLITTEQAEKKVCPTILALSKMEGLADYHTGTISLMGKMAPFLGREVVERVFLDWFSSLCSNHMFYVRKVCASHFGLFCAVVGKEAYERVLLPCYISMCADDIWGVRKACAEVIMSVSCACPPRVRRSALAPVFAKLLQDHSRWVRMSAFQTLGPFISTFADASLTGLAYNKLGELVMVNTEGTEFRLSTPSYSSSDANLRCMGELQMLYNTPHQKSPMHDKGYECNDPFAVIYNPLNGWDDCDDNDRDVDQIENAELVLEENSYEETTLVIPGTEKQEIKEIVVEQENVDTLDFDMLSPKQMFMSEMCGAHEAGDCPSSEQTNPNKFVINDVQKETVNCDILDSEVVNDISIKLASTSIENDHCYTKITDDSDSFSNCCGDSLVINSSFKELCTEDNNSQNIMELNISEKNEGITENSGNVTSNVSDEEQDNEKLAEFNSYNYWYISPEMPIDISLIDNEVSAVNMNSTNKNYASMRHPEDAYSFTFGGSLHNISPISRFSSQAVSKDDFTPFMQNMEDDDTSNPLVPQQLIDHFVSMTDPNLAQNTDNEMAYHCAYSLPAVALTLGKQNWHLLKGTVIVLASDMQYKVRRTVASSLHELAMILGPDLATHHLAPLFEGFIKDLDEVRIGVLKHLAHFLKLISPVKRNVYLPRLAEFLQTDNETNWRFRQELAEQLLLAVPLFRPIDASKHITILAQELLCDKVAAVREVALLLVTELVKHISSDATLTSRLLIKLAEKFAHSKRWKRRQTFALLSAQLLSSQALPLEQFGSEVMPHLLDLSWDPVANVRLIVARTIAQQIITNEYFADVGSQYYDGLQTVLRRLQADKDRDVRQSAVVHQNTYVTY